MSVDQIIDTYLQMAQQILGDPSAAPAAPPQLPPAVDLPHPEWLGDAASSALAIAGSLTQARQQLNTAAGNMGTATTTAAQISRDASLQLKGIINDWGAAKASLAATPQPLRDSALITAGQQHIAEAMTLVSATAARYSAAAAAVSADSSSLPSPAKTPANSQNPNLSPLPADAEEPGLATLDTLESGSSGYDPMSTLSADPGITPTALPMSASAPAMMSALPTAMGAMQNAAPAMAAPMSSMLPTAVSPLSSLGSLTSQLGSNPLSSTAAADLGATDSAAENRSSRSRPGSIGAAIDAALDALGIRDPAARARWHAGYETLIARESAGNAHAVNRSDSNARGAIQSDGAPAGSSRGLTQLIPATFRHYRLPGLSGDIYDPVSNIAASMRYVMDRHHVDPSAINLAANVQQANPRARARGY